MTMPEQAKTFVKICGITRLTDARVAVRAGANAIGFVFAPSPRRVSPSEALAIGTHLHPSVRKFGVFVDAPIDKILDVVAKADLDAVQLQGSESPELLAQLRAALPSLFISKVIRAVSRRSMDSASDFPADVIFFDRKDPSDPMLFGRPIPAKWFEGMGIGRLVVAGGLHPGNVSKLISSVRPWGVDVSSGVELVPGKKDPDKVRAFMRAVRKAESSL